MKKKVASLLFFRQYCRCNTNPMVVPSQTPPSPLFNAAQRRLVIINHRQRCLKTERPYDGPQTYTQNQHKKAKICFDRHSSRRPRRHDVTAVSLLDRPYSYTEASITRPEYTPLDAVLDDHHTSGELLRRPISLIVSRRFFFEPDSGNPSHDGSWKPGGI